MKNLWPTEFQENDKPAAKSLLEEQAKLLPQLTNDIVYADVVALEDFELLAAGIKSDFNYRFFLRGKFLEGYRFSAFVFTHDITLYPVNFMVDEGVGKELQIPRKISGYLQVINDPQELEAFITAVLRTKRITTIIGSIMRLSK